jgi:Mrp family chromosome partitioning ATPase
VLSREGVLEALHEVTYPGAEQDVVSAGMLRGVTVADARVTITLALPASEEEVRERVIGDARTAVLALEGAEEVDVTVVPADPPRRQQRGESARKDSEGQAAHLNRIERVVAVMSGKGGVGKSLVAGMLAVELRRRGFRVGLMDADITGPSIPKVFGLTERPQNSPIGIGPVKSRTGIGIMSINLLLAREDDAVIWRGPLISSAVKQFWGDVYWGTLDYLVVDMPPGTADVPLTVMQSLPLNGIILVTSPQELAGMVVRKAGNMAAQLNVPILGVVENMSYAVCPHCGKRYDLFGPSHLAAVCEPLHMPVLGHIPLDSAIAELCDAGQIEDCSLAAFGEIAERTLALVGEPTAVGDDRSGGHGSR